MITPPYIILSDKHSKAYMCNFIPWKDRITTLEAHFRLLRIDYSSNLRATIEANKIRSCNYKNIIKEPEAHFNLHRCSWKPRNGFHLSLLVQLCTNLKDDGPPKFPSMTMCKIYLYFIESTFIFRNHSNKILLNTQRYGSELPPYDYDYDERSILVTSEWQMHKEIILWKGSWEMKD